MEEVDFNDVTVNLNNYLKKKLTLFKNGTVEIRGSSEIRKSSLQITYSGFFYGGLLKCFGVGLKNKEIETEQIQTDSKVFPNGYRPGYPEDLRPITFIHSPGEFLMEPKTGRGDWPRRFTRTSYKMKFALTNVDVLMRRNKRSLPCMDHIDYDQQIFNHHAEKIGCKPPYLNVLGNFSTCISKDKIREGYFDYGLIRESLKQSCRSLQNINSRLDERDVVTKEGGFWIEFFPPDAFKEIIQVQAVDIHSLIGNCGGYIGLFCGKFELFHCIAKVM